MVQNHGYRHRLGNNATADVWQNAFDVPGNYSVSELDMRHSINGQATFDLLVGSGKRYAMHGVMDRVLGGQRVTGIYQIHSGIPFTATTANNGIDYSGSEANQCGCGYAWLPNVAGNPHLAHPSTNEWFNTAAFATPQTGSFGNERRNMLAGPNWRDLDLSLGKSFKLVEGVNFEIRGDAYNAFNHPNLAQPNAATGTGVAGGGVITSTVGATGRDLQIGGRLTF